MSSEQLTLADVDSTPSPEIPNWQPQQQPKSECQHCGAHVTERHRAVFGDEDRRVHACHECTDKEKMPKWGPGRPDDPKRPRSTHNRKPSESPLIGGRD